MNQEHVWEDDQIKFLRDRLHLKMIDAFREYQSFYGEIDINKFQEKYKEFKNKYTKSHKFTNEEKKFLLEMGISDDEIEREFNSRFGTELPSGLILRYKYRLENPSVPKPKPKRRSAKEFQKELELESKRLDDYNVNKKRKIKLYYWITYILIYHLLMLVSGLNFNIFTELVLAAALIALINKKDMWGLRFLTYALFLPVYIEPMYGPMPSENYKFICGLLIFVLGAVGLLIEFIASGGSPSKGFQIVTGKCPYCYKEVSSLATKCPHCTSDLPTR